jgi:hypothetical protein
MRTWPTAGARGAGSRRLARAEDGVGATGVWLRFGRAGRAEAIAGFARLLWEPMFGSLLLAFIRSHK